MSSSWDLKAKHDTGRIELEFGVDGNRLGQAWSVRLTDNGNAGAFRQQDDHRDQAVVLGGQDARGPARN